VESEPPGEYLALVVQLRVAADNRWYLAVDGTGPGLPIAIPLKPATLVLRLWRAGATGTLRGTVRLHDSEVWAPIQSNARLEQLVRTWLLGSPPGAGPPPAPPGDVN
jgi:hypothetical protein